MTLKIGEAIKKLRKEHGFIEEAIELCDRVLEDCTVDSIRHSAIQIPCYNYPHIDKKKRQSNLLKICPICLFVKKCYLVGFIRAKNV